MTAHRDRKSKFTASVSERVVKRVDERAAELKLTRSDVVEQAMELWLRGQSEQDEERYFTAAATEMNADAKVWNHITSSKLMNHESNGEA
ncbi:MAG TPA: ribbon-helix-helix protein, CopG family [Planktothrix sp.]|jgi:predicted transcriptional regulator